MTATPEIKLLPASIEDYPIVQNLARFYVYDRSGYMGWPCSEDGMFDCIDFKHYFEHEDEKAFLIKVNDELAGFVLLDKEHLIEPVDWNIGEFFVIAKFQGKGIATEVIQKVFQEHPGKWSIAVMPENIKAAKFWKKVISQASGGDYAEVFKTEDELRTEENPDPYAMNIFSFQIHNKPKSIHADLNVDALVKPFDLNHITLACIDIERSFIFYKEVMGFKPLVKWDKGAYFLIGESWFCLNFDSNRKSNPCYTHYAFSVKSDDFKPMSDKISKSGAYVFKDNTSPGESFYFLDPDGHKLEIHVGNWKSRIEAKKENMGSWKNVEWFV